mmetsp:Transcript_36074/g.57905  ORF Transcript_36074/g.57905 Transcript_36074/m.57905 type:complete len:135 (-) Transcript_36074:129-533(-)
MPQAAEKTESSSDCRKRKGTSSGHATTKTRSRKRREKIPEHNLHNIMNGILQKSGISTPQLQETVDLLDKVVQEYVRELIQDALDITEPGRKVETEHVMLAIMKDREKFDHANKRYNSYAVAMEARNQAFKMTL